LPKPRPNPLEAFARDPRATFIPNARRSDKCLSACWPVRTGAKRGISATSFMGRVVRWADTLTRPTIYGPGFGTIPGPRFFKAKVLAAVDRG
jgi:hypothetical protein